MTDYQQVAYEVGQVPAHGGAHSARQPLSWVASAGGNVWHHRAMAATGRHGDAESDSRISAPARPPDGGEPGARRAGPQAAERVAAAIEADVLRAGWPVGLVLGSEEQLAARYGVGRAVIREAIRLAEHRQVARMRRRPGRRGWWSWRRTRLRSPSPSRSTWSTPRSASTTCWRPGPCSRCSRRPRPPAPSTRPTCSRCGTPRRRMTGGGRAGGAGVGGAGVGGRASGGRASGGRASGRRAAGRQAAGRQAPGRQRGSTS